MAEIAEIVGVKERQVHHWAAGQHRPQNGVRDALLELRYVVKLLGDIYRPESVEIWLHSRNPELDGNRPIDLLQDRQFVPVLQAISGSALAQLDMNRNLANARQLRDGFGQGLFLRHASISNAGAMEAMQEVGGGPQGRTPCCTSAAHGIRGSVEAHRCLVDPFPGMNGAMVAPRRLYHCSVSVEEILDLRPAASLAAVGLTREDLEGAYPRCQEIGQAAHQLGLHGVIASAATSIGETLALFTRHLPATEQPGIVDEEVWETCRPILESSG